MCGDSECPSCGRAQGTYSGGPEADATLAGEYYGGTEINPLNHKAGTHFIVTYNLPGCLPEAEPVWFDSLKEAETYIREQEAEYADQFEDGEEITEDPYVFDIVPCEGDCKEES